MYFFEAKLKQQRAILLEIIPEISAVMEELSHISKTSGDEGTALVETGTEITDRIIDILLDRQYDRIMIILSALNGTTAEKLEEEKTLFDIGDMILDALTQERLLRFFPQLRVLAAKTQSAT